MSCPASLPRLTATLALTGAVLVSPVLAIAGSQEGAFLASKPKPPASCTISSPEIGCVCRALDQAWLHEIEREPITREVLRRRYPSIRFILVSVPVKDQNLNGKIVWVDPRLDSKVLICDGGTVKVAVGKYSNPTDCDNIDAAGRPLDEVLAALRSRGSRRADIVLPESIPTQFENVLQVRAQSPRLGQQARVECKKPITLVAQIKTPRDSIVGRVVGDNAELFDENGKLWKLCDGTASHNASDQCRKPPARNFVVSQWPAPSAWSETPGEIVVFTSKSALPANEEEPSSPTVPLHTVPLGILGYEALRRLLRRKDPAGGTPPAKLGTPRQGTTVRGHIDRP